MADCPLIDRSFPADRQFFSHCDGVRIRVVAAISLFCVETEIAARQPQFQVLGPFEVRVHDEVLDLGGPRIRTLLALLTANAGRVTSVGTMVEALWGPQSPPDAQRTVRSYISRLRRALAVDRLIVTHPAGYVLRLEPYVVDARRFERLVEAGRDALCAGRPADAAEQLSLALTLWRGEAYGEFTATPALRAEAARLEGLRLGAVEDRVDADLATGAGVSLVEELTGLTDRHPGRERLWGQLMTALYRAGRQAEALDALLHRRGQDLDRVIFFDVSRDELLRRLTGRRICRRCGHAFHLVSAPPKVAGVCDQCGGELYQREDDAGGTVGRRLDVYQTQTAPLLDYYKRRGLLVRVDGEGPMAQVADSIKKAVREPVAS